MKGRHIKSHGNIMKRTFSFIAFTCLLTISRNHGVLCPQYFVRCRRLEARNAKECPVENVIYETKSPSRTKCLIQCTVEPPCRGVFHDSDTLRCIICSSEGSNSTITTASTNSTFYKLLDNAIDEQNWRDVYKIVWEKMTWSDAKQNCATKLGGNLTSVKSTKEQMYVKTLMGDYKYGVWIGGRETALDDSSFKWLDGSYVSSGYKNWNGREPINEVGIIECIKISESNDYQWKTVDCENTAASVCKLE